jgi:4-diphosphocytidyl-2-C-methyl-D-erythritol kinase
MVSGDTEGSNDTVRVLAPAKVNLFVEVLGERRDGYHDILTVMQAIGLFDTVTVTRCGSGIEVSCPSNDVPSGPDNTAHHAAREMLDRIHLGGGVRVEIEKRIPVGRGLGGGSSDAAAVIRTMNGLWNDPLSPEDLTEIAAEVGSDVPFFLSGGAAVCRGRGEIVEPVESTLDTWLVVLCPPISVSTARVYREGIFPQESAEVLTRAEIGCHTTVEGLLRGDFSAVAEAVYNGFAESVFRLYPEISRAYSAFIGQYGAAALTGTGSGFFWLCRS